MDSASLESHGIRGWMTFRWDSEQDVISSLPTAPGVYVMILAQASPCTGGSSDIAYIGRARNAKGLRGRIRQYFHPGPTQSTNIAMNQRLRASDCALRVGYVVCASEALARRLESDLLNAFEEEHRQLPPFNRQRALDLRTRNEEL